MEKPAAVFLQETKLKRSGRIKTPSGSKYTWYELHRTDQADKGQNGGGLALGVLNVLEPSWVSEGDDDAEAITVEIWVEGFPIRLVCAYGPQESDRKERKTKFWDYLTKETQKATKTGAGLIIQMDGNLWAGNNIINGDPNQQNQNGKLFQEFLNLNPHLTVINALPICKGKITRKRHIIKDMKESILDFFLVCDQILPLVSKMIIDEKGEIALTKYRRGNIVKSDHNMLILKIDLAFHKENKHERIEMFNLRNKECQIDFKQKTSNTDMFSKCFIGEETIDVQFKRWKRRLQKALYSSFRKVRIKDRENKLSNLDILMNKKKAILKKKTLTEKDKREIDSIEEEITQNCEDQEFEKLSNILESLETDSGNTHPNQVWKQMRKSFPKTSKPLPTGVKNIEGKVITNPKEKKAVILEHFKHRMRKRPAKEDTKDILECNEKLFKRRIIHAKNVKSDSFSMKELENILKCSL